MTQPTINERQRVKVLDTSKKNYQRICNNTKGVNDTKECHTLGTHLPFQELMSQMSHLLQTESECEGGCGGGLAIIISQEY